MSRNSTVALDTTLITRVLLWVAPVVVASIGFVVLSASNAAQAEFYSTQSADYPSYFSAQSGSFLGSILIGSRPGPRPGSAGGPEPAGPHTRGRHR
jgi:hypothetical protein